MALNDDEPGGPLAGLRVVEFAGIGPGPHCAMLLADLGAEVLRIEREGYSYDNPVVGRGRATLVADLRSDEGRALALAAVGRADVLIEGFRPGVMERLGLGPEPLLGANPRLVYGRMTGWGQEGPLATTAGHDINYLALTGALAAIGRPGEPALPPLNLIGDFGGGSMLLAFGIMAALWERERSGAGQVIDAAIVDGVASMMTTYAGFLGSGRLSLDRAHNLLGGAAPFYRCYLCADGREIAVGALEPQFYAELLARIGAPAAMRADQYDAAAWPERSAALAALFASRPRDEWAAMLVATDACAAPVLAFDEVADHPHNRARDAYELIGGALHAAPAPRFSRTPGRRQPSGDGRAMLERWTATPIT